MAYSMRVKRLACPARPCLVILIALLLSLSLAAQQDFPSLERFPLVVLEHGATGIGEVLVLEDAEASIQAPVAVGRFLRGEGEARTLTVLSNFGRRSSATWLAFRLRIPETQGDAVLLRVREAALEDVRVFVWRSDKGRLGAWDSQASGIRVPVSQRSVPVVPLLFPLGLTAGSESLVMVRVMHPGATHLALELAGTGQAIARSVAEGMVVAALLGAFLVLCLSSLVMFIIIRDQVFLWFTVLLAFFGQAIAALSGFGYQYFWPGQSAFELVAPMAYSIAICFAGLQFIRLFMDTKRFMPRLDLAIKAMLGVLPLLLPFTLWHYELGLWVSNLGILFSLGLSLSVGLVAVRSRLARAPLFLVAYGLIIVGSALNELSSIGLFPEGWPLLICSQASLVGITLGALAFSLVLWMRVSDLRSERDAAEMRNQFKQQFIATISHEMRTPLNAIIGFSEANLSQPDQALCRENNRLILAESGRLLFQINQVLDLAKLEAGRLILEMHPFSLEASLNHLRAVFNEAARRQGIELDFRTEGRLPDLVLGDRLRLEQVLRNLLDNAIKFTPQGQVSLELGCWPVSAGLYRLLFTVSDTGIGIPENKQQAIFEDFVQAEPGVTRRFGGTGLGVSISRRLVEAMGGSLELRSRVGIGSSFSFSLMLAGSPGAEEAEAAPVLEKIEDPLLGVPPAVPPRAGAPLPAAVAKAEGRPRVLVVDDFATNRQVVKVHLSDLGIELDEAADGLEALAMIARQAYSLVLMDFFMPGMSGIEVVAEIRRSRSAAELPVLGITASTDEAELDQALKAGMNGIMVKPYFKQDLQAKVKEYLAGAL